MSAPPKSNCIWLIIFIGIFFIFPLEVNAAKEPLIRVLLGYENRARFRGDGDKSIFVKGISSNEKRIKSLNLILSQNRVQYSINDKNNSWIELPKNFNLIIRNNDKRGIWFKKRRYAGELRVSLNDQKLQIINNLKLEKYLKSVVGSEMPKDFPLAALQAQSIAARTYALKLLGNKKSYDIHSTQDSQVYLGLESETPNITKAVSSTDSLVLFHQNELISAVFHSSSGGRTENSGQVWKYQLPYLVSVIDYDQNSPKYKWIKIFNSPDLEELFPDLGVIYSVQIIKRSNTDRALKIRLYGKNGIENISGKSFRKKFKLLSTRFDLGLKLYDNKLKNTNYNNDNYSINFDSPTVRYSLPQPLPLIPKDYFLEVKGYGAGHGVGLSQWGARAMAERGADFSKILKHYYTGVEISFY